MSLMRQMVAGDSVLIKSRGLDRADVAAQSIGAKVGGKWHTRRIQMIEENRIITGVILTCVESPRPSKPRGRPRKAKPLPEIEP